jgi:ATP-dependent protease HslVU (ClpYQ) peptidase subunit
MTVIAAIAREGRVWMAADTASHAGATRFASQPKIRAYPDGVLLAAAGTACGLPSLRDPKLMPKCATDDLDEWAQCVAEKVTEHLAGLTPSLLNEGSLEIELLLGYRGRLWYLDANLANRIPDGIGVLGTGADIAYGALHAMPHAPAFNAVTTAVAIACMRNAGCALVDGAPQVESA